MAPISVLCGSFAFQRVADFRPLPLSPAFRCFYVWLVVNYAKLIKFVI